MQHSPQNPPPVSRTTLAVVNLQGVEPAGWGTFPFCMFCFSDEE